MAPCTIPLPKFLYLTYLPLLLLLEDSQKTEGWVKGHAHLQILTAVTRLLSQRALTVHISINNSSACLGSECSLNPRSPHSAGLRRNGYAF